MLGGGTVDRGAHRPDGLPEALGNVLGAGVLLKVGAVGTLGSAPNEHYMHTYILRVKVLQVVDKSHAIISIEKRQAEATKFQPDTRETVWATVLTEGMVSDKDYVFAKEGAIVADYSTLPTLSRTWNGKMQMFKVTGTRTYSTALGSSRTVFAVEPTNELPAAVIAEAAQRKQEEDRVQNERRESERLTRQAEAEKAKRQAAIERAKWHIWTIDDGSRFIEAKFVKAIADSIYLVLQHHFAIGDFPVLSHTGGAVDRAGQFGDSWKSSGGLCHGYDRTARSVRAIGEPARAFRSLVRATRVPGARLGLSPWLAAGH